MQLREGEQADQRLRRGNLNCNVHRPGGDVLLNHLMIFTRARVVLAMWRTCVPLIRMAGFAVGTVAVRRLREDSLTAADADVLPSGAERLG